MNWLDLAQYKARMDEHAAAVAATPGICPFCSDPQWQLAALEHLNNFTPSRFLIAERDGAWLVLTELSQGKLQSFESTWYFASPIAGPPDSAVALSFDAMLSWRREKGEPIAICISGLVAGGEIDTALRNLIPDDIAAYEVDTTGVMIIDLTDGAEAWLSRRSKKFRRTMHSAREEILGLEIVDASHEDPDQLWQRILEIQQASYKWREGMDIFQFSEYAEFYRDLLYRLHSRGALRLLFAQRYGVDLAHIFGGVLGVTYRGLQMSYREEARDLALGNRLQWENILARANEGVTRYDLGMPAPYKYRWADREELRRAIVLRCE